MEAILHWQTTVDKTVAEHILIWQTAINTQIMKGCCPAIIKHHRTEGWCLFFPISGISNIHAGIFQIIS
jgi:hypothetical protein